MRTSAEMPSIRIKVAQQNMSVTQALGAGGGSRDRWMAGQTELMKPRFSECHTTGVGRRWVGER